MILWGAGGAMMATKETAAYAWNRRIPIAWAFGYCA